MSDKSSERSDVAEEKASAIGDEKKEVKLSVDAKGRNKKSMACQFCDTKILLPGVGQFVEKKLVLHTLSATKGSPTTEQLTNFWLVGDQFQFENIAVTHPAGGERGYKYLACAQCDRGPVGILFLDAPSQFLIAHSRVKHGDGDG